VYDPVVLRHVPENDRVPEAPQRVERAVEAVLTHPALKLLMPSPPTPLSAPPHQQDTTTETPETIGTTTGPHNLITWLKPRYATPDEIYHTHPEKLYSEFLTSGSSLSNQIPFTTTDLYCDEKGDSMRAVLATCGMVIDASKAVVEGLNSSNLSSNTAMCLVRPPGHHCSHEKPGGFCLVNNVIVAADALRRQVDTNMRIAIVDCDVHHGDGTQLLIEDDPRYFYYSTHRCDKGAFFPYGTGKSDNIGKARNCMNVPFDTDATTPSQCHQVMSDYSVTKAADEILVEKLVAFRPDVVYISCGFDALYGDQLGRMGLSINGYRNVVVAIRKAFATLTRTEPTDMGKNRGIVLVLEGGYNPTAVSKGVVAMLSALLLGKGSELCAVASGPTMNTKADWGPSYFDCKVPPTWDDLRAKQIKLLSQYNAAAKDRVDSDVVIEAPETTEGHKNSESTEEGEEVTKKPIIPVAPTTVDRSNEELTQAHIMWVGLASVV
jgi:acetoin utilization deacetylase AcuC-like enzyme